MKIKSIALVLITLISFGGVAQDSIKSNKIGLIVKADVFLPLTYLAFSKVERQVSLTLEKTIKRRNSFQLSATYYSINKNGNSPDSSLGNKRKIIQLIPEYKFFILKRKICSGPYIGAYLKFIRDEEIWDFTSYPNLINNNYYADYYYFKYAIGAITGYQFYIKNKLTIDFLLGIGGNKTFSQEKIGGGNINSTPTWQLDGRLAINIGYKF